MSGSPFAPLSGRILPAGLFLFCFCILALPAPLSVSAAPPPSDSITLDQDNPAPGAFGVIPLQDGASRLILFPTQDVFTPLLADPREPLTTIEFFAASNHPSYLQFNGNLAANVGIARWESTAEGVNKALQIGVMGGDFSRFGIFGANTYLIDSDFIVGVPVTARIGRFSQRLFFYHESSHTGYDYTVMDNLSKVSDFGQEILQEVSSWDVSPYLRLYGGVSYRVFGLYYYPTAQDSLILQGGIEAFTPSFGFLDHVGRGYTSLYLESRGINGYTLNEDFQLGLLFHRPGSYVDIRPMIDFYNGYSYLGDLLFTKDQYMALGVSFDF